MVSKQAKITSKGQITIPVEVRYALNIQEGDIMNFEVVKGQAIMQPANQESVFSRYAGTLRENKELSAKDIVEEIREERGW